MEKQDRASQLNPCLSSALSEREKCSAFATIRIDDKEESCDDHDLPFFSRLLRRLFAASESSLSLSFFAESDKLSQLNCRFNAVAFRADARLSGVFLAEEVGLSNRLGSGVKLFGSLVALRFALVKPLFTGVKPPELTAVNPPDVGACEGWGGASLIGVSRSVSIFNPLMLA